MDQLLVILIALAVGGFAFCIWQVIAVLSDGERRKLQQRLSMELRASHGGGEARRTLRLQEQPSGLPDVFDGIPLVSGLQRRLSQSFPNTSLLKFLLIDFALCGSAAAVGWFVAESPLMTLIFGLIAGALPFLVLSSRGNKRRRMVTEQLPDALDFLSRVLKSGQSLATGFHMISEELPDPLASEFGRCYDQSSLGQSLDDGIRDMATRLESEDVAFFATAVLIQRQSGGDLAEVLQNISGMIRKRLRLLQSVKAKTAEGRFTGYVMVAFPAVMFSLAWMLNPDYGRLLLHTSTGQMLLGVAFGLQMFGLFLIRKITAVKV